MNSSTRAIFSRMALSVTQQASWARQAGQSRQGHFFQNGPPEEGHSGKNGPVSEMQKSGKFKLQNVV